MALTTGMYGSVSGASKRINKLYASVNGQTKRLVKLYGSVDGKSKQIFPTTSIDAIYGTVVYYTDFSLADTATAVIKNSSEFLSLSNENRYWTAAIDGQSISNLLIKEVKLTSMVTSIPSYFLHYCTMLDSIDMSEATRLASIGDSFLNHCSSFNSAITIPSTVQSIGDNFLSYCNSFDKPITIPDGVTSIGALLYACSSFNSQITLPTSLVEIGNLFLYGATAFNKPLTIPNNVTTIGLGFMDTCSAFNSNLTLPSHLISIGNAFMNNCSSFNQSLSIPNSVSTINWGFLTSCTSFNQSITIPANVTSIGYSFMYDCRKMTSTINFGTLAATVLEESNKTLATTATYDPAYSTGIRIAGANRAAIMARFPNTTSNVPPVRKLINAGH